jgi:hypothetical protein
MIDIRYLFENFFVNKFELKYSKRIAANTLLVKASRHDEFGRAMDYEFYFLSEKVSTDYIDSIKCKSSSNIIIIGTVSQNGVDFTEAEFFDKLSTVIDPGIYLNSDLPSILLALGHNQLPKSMTGVAADLLETYSKECLQFLLGGKGRRYGKERSFESLPDGVILGRDVTILFDAKAYKDGFNPSADDLKRFQSYITDFNKKYEQFVGRVFSFVVVSGHFDVGDDALVDRSRELYEMCQTSLSFISCEELSKVVQISIENHLQVESINWKKILSKPVPSWQMLVEQIDKIKKDRIL